MGGIVSGSSGSSNFKLARPTLSTYTPDVHHDLSRYDKFRVLPEQQYPVWDIAVASQLGILAVATADSEVHLWNLKTYELKVSLRAHSAAVWCVKFSPNEQILATSSSDGTIRLWEAETGTPVGVLRGHSDCVRSLAFSPQDVLLSASMDETLALWEPDNTTPLAKWNAHEGAITSVAFVETDPDLGVSLGTDGSIAVWRVRAGADGLVVRFPGGDGCGVLSMSCHPVLSGVVATGCEDGGVWLWVWEKGAKHQDVNDIKWHQHLRGHAMAVWAVSFASSGSVLASGSADCKIRVWNTMDLRTPQLLNVFTAHETWVRCLCWRATVVGHDRVWQETHEENAEPRKVAVHVPILAPNAELVAGCVDGKVSFWTTPREVQRLSCTPSLGELGGSQSPIKVPTTNGSNMAAQTPPTEEMKLSEANLRLLMSSQQQPTEENSLPHMISAQ